MPPLLAAAHGREDRYFVAVGEERGVAVGGLVAVDPDARSVEHGREVVAVRLPGAGQQLAQGGGRVDGPSTTGRLASLREEEEPDTQA